jgi:membrane protein YqaA with SNARE-associated domain
MAAIWAALKPLGAWGVFAIAGIDGAGVPLPGAVDVVVVSYVYSNPHRAWLYVVAAAVGSTLGCIIPYMIGYAGGEVLLHKRMNPAKFERTRNWFEQHRVLALMLPAMLPPPFPFKIFVLSAAVFEVKFAHFIGSILAGRSIRFAVLALLTIFFGPNILLLLQHHYGFVLLGIVALILLALIIRRMRRTEPEPLL